MKKKRHHLDLFERDPRPWIFIQQPFEQLDDRFSFLTGFALRCLPTRRFFDPHRLFHHPLVVRDRIVQTPFRVSRRRIRLKRCPAKQQTIQRDTERPYIDRFRYRRTAAGRCRFGCGGGEGFGGGDVSEGRRSFFFFCANVADGHGHGGWSVDGVFVDDLGGHEFGCAVPPEQVRVVEEDGVFPVFYTALAATAAGGEEESIGEMGGAKVGYFDLTAVLGPEEVGGFDVAVDDTLVMDFFYT